MAKNSYEFNLKAVHEYTMVKVIININPHQVRQQST